MHLQLLEVLEVFYVGVVQFKPLLFPPVSMALILVPLGMAVLVYVCGSAAEDLGGGWFPALPAEHVYMLLIQFL